MTGRRGGAWEGYSQARRIGLLIASMLLLALGVFAAFQRLWFPAVVAVTFVFSTLWTNGAIGRSFRSSRPSQTQNVALGLVMVVGFTVARVLFSSSHYLVIDLVAIILFTLWLFFTIRKDGSLPSSDG